MVFFKVRAESLSEVAALIGNVIVTFDANLASADSVVSRMAGTTWVGDDAEKFSEDWASFVTLASQVRLALTGLQQGLIAADGSYTRTETGIGTGFRQRQQGLVSVRSASGNLSKRVAKGEDKAEDMAEFFGRDYAGDDEVEQFGGGALGPRKTSGQATGGGSGDSDGDGDDDSIGTDVFRLDADGEPDVNGYVEVDVDLPDFGPVVEAFEQMQGGSANG